MASITTSRLASGRTVYRVRRYGAGVRREAGRFDQLEEAEKFIADQGWLRDERVLNGRSSRTSGHTISELLSANSVRDDSGCLLWTGRVDRDGYGVLTVHYDGKPGPKFVHRLAYVESGKRLIAGLTIDHLCHSNDLSCPGGNECFHRRCIDPSHLEQVTARENTRRRQTSLRAAS